MEFLNLNEEVQTAVRIAKAVAVENGNGMFTAAHLLKALLYREVGLLDFLASLEKDVAYLNEWAEIRMEESPKHWVGAEVEPDDSVCRTFEEADRVRISWGLLELNPISVLCALSKPSVAFSADQLRSFPIREKEILDLFQSKTNDGVASQSGEKKTTVSHWNNSNTSALQKYCLNKKEQYGLGKLRAAVGRNGELLQMEEILGRFSKPNVMVIGDAGVGKTALVNGLFYEMASGRILAFRDTMNVWELDFGTFMAGASYKGELDDRLKSITKELRQLERGILFIDDIHLLLDSRQGVSGLSGILKSELSKCDITMVATTTEEQYRKLIERDSTFSRQFELLHLDEPSVSLAVEMMKSVLPTYQEFHHLTVEERTLSEAVSLAKRYVHDRRLPDSAIDLIDRTMTAVRLANASFASCSEWLNAQLSELEGMSASENAPKNEEGKAWNNLRRELSSKLNPVALSLLDYPEKEEEQLSDELTYFQEVQHKLRDLALRGIESVAPNHVATIVSSKTGIPLGKLQTGEKSRLLNMESTLRHRVVGQDRAVRALVDAILESRSGMNKQGQPIGSFFFLGPTGTGKTELSKALAEALFNDEKAMIRFDMSEFKEEHSAALLYGAPPGYVGYEEGGMLVNKIRQQPYSVLLFDEIEKAHPSVFDVFLQILDEGKLHDRLGREGDFSNSIVIFTSNVGSDWILQEQKANRWPTTVQLMENMGAYFRPEFLARLSEIVPFSPIDDTVLLQIFEIQFQGFRKLLVAQNRDIMLEEEAKRMLAFKGFTPKYGARQVSGVIRNYLRRQISRMILSGELKEHERLVVNLDATSELSFVVEPIL
ncbi:MAG: ATP-dependent Clp protease ATP-binding subunit [Paludibacteraceae bacterium]|nr:ATP-dependent Clp protease ATP-binding subunit [Paludibacteraceae bacterium]